MVLRKPDWKIFGISRNSCHARKRRNFSKDTGIRRDDNIKMIVKEEGCVSVDCIHVYRGDRKSLARPTSRCILFDGENIFFMLVLYIYIYIYRVSHELRSLLRESVPYVKIYK